MATSTWSYRRSTNMSSGDRGNDAALKSKLEQARQQRTAFYRRLADAGARGQTDDDDDDSKDVEIDVETSTRRRRQRMDNASPHADVVSSVSSTQSSFVEQLPEPRSSWRYYTSYDNGEWRRHATPIYKADAELDVGISARLAERRSASLTSGLSTHDDIVEVENGEGSSSHSRQMSAHTRPQRLRGSACLTRDLPPSTTTSATDSGPTTLEEVKTVMKDVFDRSRYGASYDVSELVQKILGERQREPSPPHTKDRVIYANQDRRSILDNVTQPLRPTIPEILEGSDEKEFEEKTLAPSGRRWTSSPSRDSQRIIFVQNLLNDNDFDGGLRYEEIGIGARECGTSLENQRDSSCRSPSNVPETVNGEGVEAGEMEARWGGVLPTTGRTVVTSESTRRQETRTVSEAAPPTSMTTGRQDAFGRRIPNDAVEIKVEIQRGDSGSSKEHPSPSKSRLHDERNTAAVEQWLHGCSDTTSPGVVEMDVKREARNGSAARREMYSDHVGDVAVTPTTSSSDGWTRVTKPASTDDGRIWIPVIHVSGTPTSKNEATKSEEYSSRYVVETETRRDKVVSPTAVSHGPVSTTSRAFVDMTDPRRQDRSDTAQFRELREVARDTEEVTEVTGPGHQSPATSSLRTGSGVGSYGFRSSITVDRGSTRDTQPVVSQTTSSRSGDVRQQSASDGEWFIEKAL